MGSFNLSQVVNPSSLPVNILQVNNIVSNSLFGAEKCITPNYPRDNRVNPWFIGPSSRFKQFGSIERGRNNELFLVTRVGGGHGISGGELYWSVSYDEGMSWSAPTKFTQDTVTDANAEDLRDVTLTYDNLIDKYFLIYVHQYGIVDEVDYSRRTGDLKVWIGDEPFANMVDVSPSIIKTDGAVGNTIFSALTQTFHKLVRIGSYLYLPVYGNDVAGGELNKALIKFSYNDSLPFDTQWCYWETIKRFDNEISLNETTLFVTYQDNGSPRMNLLSRAGDMGYLTYSDDMGTTWSELSSIGIDVAGGPQVFQIGDIYMLVAREQKLLDGNAATIFAMFSIDGVNWKHRIELGNQGTSYASMAHMDSGKLIVCYSKEFNHTGIQCIRSVVNLPKYEDLVTTHNL